MFKFFMGTMFPSKLKTQKITSYPEDYNAKGSLEDSPYVLKINLEQCQIKSTNFNYRKVVSIPLFLVVLAVFIFMINSFFENHYSNYKSFISVIYGYKDIYENSVNPPEAVELYRPFFDKTPNLFDYLISYYSGNFYAGTEYSIYLTILFAFAFGYALYITGKSVFIGPYPILVLDRKRNLLYTWENKKVYVARYEDAGYAAPSNNLFIKLFTFNSDKNRLETILFQPNASVHSSLFLSEEYENNAFISFINAYMQKGRDAITDHDFGSEPLKFYFGSYEPPIDVDAQIAKTLNQLDKEKPIDA
ncbi:hypothetical protein AAH235_002808 [Providencia stuartii]|uniref:Uncharacterized protein n=2 Tax=Morganellaceae TaxID=1903414 RepID=A0AA87CSS9_PROST|nr:hypothetical protein [Providencia stuartii]EDU61232.1 hypothetical protein PROSTU_00762 [Providencia stuartii ATCC 25827]WIJ72546.1 hypothetical protein OI982_13640 [Providencia thailandensis]AIN65714.1 hypothetical protein DR96_1289 [Providencia stuartii]MBG5898647.1 hypothetical protein [Providencia stuartii]MBK1419424.1 hypothetical protein [Providencia stuartii]